MKKPIDMNDVNRTLHCHASSDERLGFSAGCAMICAFAALFLLGLTMAHAQSGRWVGVDSNGKPHPEEPMFATSRECIGQWIRCANEFELQQKEAQRMPRTAADSTIPARPVVGPSFNCAATAVANQPLAQLICSSDRIAHAELNYIIAYMALRQISNDAEQVAMRAEANAFTTRINAACGIPRTGRLGGRPASENEVNCLAGKFDEERSRLFKRLNGDAIDEAELTPEQAITIQRLLKEKGFLPANAPLDGVFGPATREAIGNWQRSNGQPGTGFGSGSLLAQLQGSPPTQSRAPEPALNDSALPRADISACAAPPYGATTAAYQAWKGTFGQRFFEGREDFIKKMCEVKLGGNPEARAMVHRLGFRDEDIAYYSMGDFWVEVVGQIRRLARSTND